MIMGFLATYFGGRAAKAVMAGTTGVISAGIGSEVIGAVQGGIAEGVMPAAHEAGMVIGGVIGGLIIFLLNHIPTYWKANKSDI